MSKFYVTAFLLLLIFNFSSSGQPVQVTVNANSGKQQFSPFIFGKNNVLPSTFFKVKNKNKVL